MEPASSRTLCQVLNLQSYNGNSRSYFFKRGGQRCVPTRVFTGHCVYHPSGLRCPASAPLCLCDCSMLHNLSQLLEGAPKQRGARVQDEADVILHNSSFSALSQVPLVKSLHVCLQHVFIWGSCLSSKPSFTLWRKHFSHRPLHTACFTRQRPLSCAGHGHSPDDGFE